MDAIKKSCESLIVLINDTLDLAKVDAGKMSFLNNEFSLGESISDIFKLLLPICKEKK
jgi:two-component system CheB/CheR fusion protein